MTGGEIAGLIAAGAFLLLVLFLAVPILKLGRVLDEARFSVRDISRETLPLLKEATDTVSTANRELAKFDGVTTHVASIVETVTGAVSTFSTALGGPLGRVAGIVGAFTGGRRNSKKKKG